MQAGRSVVFKAVFVLGIVLWAFSLTSCGDKEADAKKLGFDSSKEMAEVQAKGFHTKQDFILDQFKKNGFSDTKEMAVLEAKGFKTKQEFLDGNATALKLGFADVEEMKNLQSRGYKDKAEYLEVLKIPQETCLASNAKYNDDCYSRPPRFHVELGAIAKSYFEASQYHWKDLPNVIPQVAWTLELKETKGKDAYVLNGVASDVLINGQLCIQEALGEKARKWSAFVYGARAIPMDLMISGNTPIEEKPNSCGVLDEAYWKKFGFTSVATICDSAESYSSNEKYRLLNANGQNLILKEDTSSGSAGTFVTYSFSKENDTVPKIGSEAFGGVWKVCSGTMPPDVIAAQEAVGNKASQTSGDRQYDCKSDNWVNFPGNVQKSCLAALTSANFVDKVMKISVSGILSNPNREKLIDSEVLPAIIPIFQESDIRQFAVCFKVAQTASGAANVTSSQRKEFQASMAGIGTIMVTGAQRFQLDTGELGQYGARIMNQQAQSNKGAQSVIGSCLLPITFGELYFESMEAYKKARPGWNP